ncbi:hypothetical protein X975_08427, partial [Stegodyphus mimosarum]
MPPAPQLMLMHIVGLRCLKRAIQNKCRGMLTNGVCLYHDNASPRTALQIKALLKSFKQSALQPGLRI